MDPDKRSTKVILGILYALVILIVLAVSLQGYTRDVVRFAKGLWSESSQNASPR